MLLFYALLDVFTAILGAIIFYTLFKPLYVYLIEKKNLYSSFAAIIIITISFLIIVLPCFSLCWMIVNKLNTFNYNLQQFKDTIDKINNFTEKRFHDPNLLGNSIIGIEKWALNIFPSAITQALETVLKITLMYFILYFMLVECNKFETALLKYAPFGNINNKRLAIELKNITYANILGQGIIALVQGILVGLGFFIFELKDPFFWAVITVFLSFLPVLGSPLIFLPAGIIAIVSGKIISGVGIIFWGFGLVINIDNFMRLFIAKKIANIHPLITIIGLVAGVPLFGILGLVFGPLLLSYFILLISFYTAEFNNNAAH